ncbi:L10-interacting MYB domain-containing protein [Linum perenne]
MFCLVIIWVVLYIFSNLREMSIQLDTSNDRPRTYWTPTMERYFVDLMLEQMHRGNRSGHTFSKQAWTDMLTVFNSKFGSQYDKDILKSRYTNLWKQFNDVQNILGQNGFSWDETRQIVVADDHTWNAYLKVHPDARSYRTKPVLNFSDLCIVYGHTTADGRYSRSSHDLDFEDEVQGLKLGVSAGSVPQSGNGSLKTEWNAEMDQYFIELMLDQIGRGNKVDGTFSKQAWTDMLSLFNAKFCTQHLKRVLRHRYKKLLKYYNDLNVLLGEVGFSWDQTQQKIIASDNIWDSYIKAHPHARAYRMKTLPNYNDLVLIFGNAIDNGEDNNLCLDRDSDVGISEMNNMSTGIERTLGSNDRKRTFWTPPMDRYLIDLLLEQVDRGNRIGKTFITQAWIVMVESFNSKFEAHHDKEVLKNRYKHFRRLHNEITSILKRSGFSWDDRREMIIAEDHAWDSYTKEQPDARSFKIRIVPGYQKLSAIFKQENYDGRYSRLAKNATTDDSSEAPLSMTGDSSGVDWQPEMDRYFIDLMLEALHQGLKYGNNFSEPAWAQMVESFNKRFSLLWDKNILENRYMELMRECDYISCLLSCNEFTWDESREMLIADDKVWEAYAEGQPGVIAYRNKVLDSYIGLCQIQRNEALNNVFVDQDMWNDDDHGVLVAQMNKELDSETNIRISNDQKKRGNSTEASCPMYYCTKLQKFDMAGGVSKQLETLVTVVEKRERKRQIVPIEAAIDALQAMADMDDELLLDACDLLEDEKKAKTFLALDGKLRKKWLQRKLRPEG